MRLDNYPKNLKINIRHSPGLGLEGVPSCFNAFDGLGNRFVLPVWGSNNAEMSEKTGDDFSCEALTRSSELVPCWPKLKANGRGFALGVRVPLRLATVHRPDSRCLGKRNGMGPCCDPGANGSLNRGEQFEGCLSIARGDENARKCVGGVVGRVGLLVRGCGND